MQSTEFRKTAQKEKLVPNPKLRLRHLLAIRCNLRMDFAVAVFEIAVHLPAQH
jgi:hypothetical protein